MSSLILPWPAWALWPNSRVDRRAATKHRAKAKEYAFYEMLENKLRFPMDAKLLFEFVPPSRTKRFDLDNALAACKAYIDGIALASDCDDDQWSYVLTKSFSLLEKSRGHVQVWEIPDLITGHPAMAIREQI